MIVNRHSFKTLPVRSRQAGVVLMVAMIMLIIISLLAAITVRNATSSEGINANLRQTQLATQAAETALRYCEDAAINLVNEGTGTFAFTSPSGSAISALALANVAASPALGTTSTAVVTTNWDTTTDNGQLILPISTVNLSGVTTTFARPPECMIQRAIPDVAESYLSVLTITSRGFGPEVPAANNTRARPVGSEVWLQSTIELN